MEQQVITDHASSTRRRGQRRRPRRRQRVPEAATEAVVPETDIVTISTTTPVSVTAIEQLSDIVTIPTVPTLTHTEYKNNVNKLFNEYTNCRDKEIRNKLAIVAYEYLVQPDMLRASTSSWLITWRASIWNHIIYDNKSDSDKPYLQEAAITIGNILESDGRYNVSATKFIEIYDWIINFMSSRTAYTTCYAASLLAYMNKINIDIWNDVPAEKKESICSKVIEWKEHPKSTNFGLFDNCKYFLEKYIV